MAARLLSSSSFRAVRAPGTCSRVPCRDLAAWPRPAGRGASGDQLGAAAPADPPPWQRQAANLSSAAAGACAGTPTGDHASPPTLGSSEKLSRHRLRKPRSARCLVAQTLLQSSKRIFVCSSSASSVPLPLAAASCRGDRCLLVGFHGSDICRLLHPSEKVLSIVVCGPSSQKFSHVSLVVCASGLKRLQPSPRRHPTPKKSNMHSISCKSLCLRRGLLCRKHLEAKAAKGRGRWDRWDGAEAAFSWRRSQPLPAAPCCEPSRPERESTSGDSPPKRGAAPRGPTALCWQPGSGQGSLPGGPEGTASPPTPPLQKQFQEQCRRR